MPLVLTAVLAEFVNQEPRRIRNWNLAVQDVVPVHVISIRRLISALVSLNDGAVKAYSGKNAFAARIRQNFGVQLQIRRGRGLPSDGSRRYRKHRLPV